MTVTRVAGDRVTRMPLRGSELIAGGLGTFGGPYGDVRYVTVTNGTVAGPSASSACSMLKSNAQ